MIANGISRRDATTDEKIQESEVRARRVNSAYQLRAEKNQALGYAGLNAGSKVAVANLPVMVGDSGAGGTAGLAPAPATGDATKFLRGDGTYATPSGGSGLTHPQVMARVYWGWG